MKDFEELLDGVLREDAEVNPRIGFERRMLARILTKPRRSSHKWRIWSAALTASVLSVAVVVWTNTYLAPTVQRVSLPAALSQSTHSHVAIAKDHNESPKLGKRLQTLGIKRTATMRGAKNRPALLREDPIRIKPIEIESLVIEPIQIASLTTRTTKFGYERGEVR